MLAHTLLTLAGLVGLSTAGYVIEDDYEPSSFFSKFDFFTGGDPTHGFVNYMDQGSAQSAGLINTNGGAVYMGVDYTNVASGSGRSSVRITSSKSYNHGLIIADIAHMPGGICGTWPAFWTVGPNWPSQGEIDIIEGVNDQSANDMTLHTSAGCSITNNGGFTGQITTPNCDVNAAGQAANAGCQIATSDSSTYGAGFNANGGGVYATEWTSDHVSIWFFPRGSIPSDALSSTPNPAGWGNPVAKFAGSCNIDNSIQNQQIVFDTTFCGDWAGNVWGQSACSAKASTCQAFVQNNPSAFKDAYWSINSLKVFQSNGNSNTPPSQSTQNVPPPQPITSTVSPLQSPPEATTSIKTTTLTSTTTKTTTTLVPTPTSLIGSIQPPRPTITVSALQFGQFPSTGETQTAGIKKRSDKKNRRRDHAQHLAMHKARDALVHA